MSTLGTQLHYHCCFILEFNRAPQTSWGTLVKEVRRWITGSIRRTTGTEQVPDSLGKRWFFEGDSWKLPSAPRVVVRTASVPPSSGERDAARHWAVHYEHPCAEIQHRQWATDIGIKPIEESPGMYLFSLRTHYWLLSGYLGDEPPSPVPTAPGIVSALFRSGKWKVRGGSVELRDTPMVIPVGSGDTLRDLLIDPERPCPVIYASCDAETGGPLVDCGRLAKLLAGTALICQAGAHDLDQELDWLLRGDHKCARGMIRVYQPRVDFATPRDARRHRWLTAARIRERSPEDVLSLLVRSVGRRFERRDEGSISTVEDIALLRQRMHLISLRAKASAAPSPEYLTALEEDNTSMNSRLLESEATIRRLQERIEGLELERLADEEQISKLESAAEVANARAQDAFARSSAIRNQAQALENLAELPSTLPEVLGLIEKLHAARVAFTPEARKSAFLSAFDDIHEAWKCLWAVATELHDLYFDGETHNIQSEFRSRTGFELALNEGSMTQRDSKLMALRKVAFEGRMHDITPHVKIGSDDPSLLRVHYAVDRKLNRLVVGHCGGHLRTAGTRRRKER